MAAWCSTAREQGRGGSEAVTAKRCAAAAERNKSYIAEVLAQSLPQPPCARSVVLEIASGSGQHALCFAERMPHLDWQPTDRDEAALESQFAWREEVALHNLRAPLRLDVERWPWPVTEAASIVCINMIHIAPWSACEALFAGAARALPPGAPLFLYGPFRVGGAHTAPSNEAFDARLRGEDPSWGVRDVGEVVHAAEAHGFSLARRIAMPANNQTLIFHAGAREAGHSLRA
jgi:hypothetical protein